MKRSFLWKVGVGSLIFGLVLSAVSGAPEKKKPAPPPALDKLSWLAGNWRMEKNGRLIDEHWMAPAGGLMLGMARTIAKGRVVEQEFMQIREGPVGALFYIAQPSGQKQATFPLASITETAVVFENPEHDFPQKISYTLQSNGSVLAAIEGTGADGQVKRIEYPYVKVVP